MAIKTTIEVQLRKTKEISFRKELRNESQEMMVPMTVHNILKFITVVMDNKPCQMLVDGGAQSRIINPAICPRVARRLPTHTSLKDTGDNIVVSNEIAMVNIKYRVGRFDFWVWTEITGYCLRVSAFPVCFGGQWIQLIKIISFCCAPNSVLDPALDCYTLSDSVFQTLIIMDQPKIVATKKIKPKASFSMPIMVLNFQEEDE